MPICNKPGIPVGSRKGTTEIDDHASESAKMKRAREQAYFNSYNFDAIEVLPYDNEENEADDDDATAATSIEEQQKGTRGKTLMKYQRKERNTPSATKQNLNGDSLKRLESSSSSSNLSSSGSGRSDSNKILSMKYSYLQRLGAFFVNAHHADPNEPLNSINSEKKVNAADGNFLLPRAMLKYQSCVGASNSMPPAAVATQQQSTASLQLQPSQTQTQTQSQHHQQQTQQQQQQQQLQQIGVSKISQNDNNKIGNSQKAMMMANSAISLANTLLPNGNEQQHQSRLNYATITANGHEEVNTGFLTLKENLVSRKTLPRNKKQSTGSTTTTVTTASTVSIASLEIPHAETATATATNAHSAVVVIDTEQHVNSVKGNSKVGNHAGNNSDFSPNVAATTESVEAHGRAHSHQSHYSTDKSGSSGYYSSNVCSTYSIEDHIYCEPVIDILDLNGKSKSSHKSHKKSEAEAIFTTKRQQLPPIPPIPPLSGVTASLSMKVHSDEAHAASQTRTMNGVGNSQRFAVDVTGDTEDDEDESDGKLETAVTLRHKIPQNFCEKLRVLETSIDNLDRHLKSFPSFATQDRIVSFVQTHQHFLQHNESGEKQRLPYNHLLPTIMEGYDPANQPRPWQDDIADDSLLDIDLDSFLLSNEAKDTKRKTATPAGIDNPTFITDELEENNYKCAKYINSCPDNAYRVESDIGASESRGSASQKSISAEHYLRRYEDQLHFQNTRELLEDVRDKIRILSQSNSEASTSSSSRNKTTIALNPQLKSGQQSDPEVPKELGAMIKTLKSELESYLDRMNMHSEYEIRQLYSGLLKNENVVKMKKAFERRRSLSEYDYYEAIRGDISSGALKVFNAGVPQGIRQQIASIRCASDPNFKMKRKSLNEVFPAVNCYVESMHDNCNRQLGSSNDISSSERQCQTQMQRNLSFHKPILNQFDSKIVTSDAKQVGNASSSNGRTQGQGLNGRSSTESGESGGDKDSILEWHRKKPSIWEMYYGTNRMHQSLLGKRNGMVVNVNQSTMSYPSSRPESDFTLDLPRAEQLRIKMEKEKKFRQRCRFITTFLSLVFFLLTVMVVSLVLTRGKRMFGSMI